MRSVILLVTLLLGAAVGQAQNATLVKVGGLSCGLVRRGLGPAKVQTYCFAGPVVVFNDSSQLASLSTLIQSFNYGTGCNAVGRPGPCDVISYTYTDNGTTISYTVSLNQVPLKTGTLN